METQQVAETEPQYVAKLSVRGIGCKPVGTATPTKLCRIFGKADGLKVGEDKTDGRIWQALTGSFAAVNMQTGEEFRSGKLFLPAGIHEVVENAVKAIEASGQKGLSVKFGLEIASVEAKNPIGYSYRAVNLVETEATDELTEIRKAIEAARDENVQKALPAAPPQKTETAKTGSKK